MATATYTITINNLPSTISPSSYGYSYTISIQNLAKFSYITNVNFTFNDLRMNNQLSLVEYFLRRSQSIEGRYEFVIYSENVSLSSSVVYSKAYYPQIDQSPIILPEEYKHETKGILYVHKYREFDVFITLKPEVEEFYDVTIRIKPPEIKYYDFVYLTYFTIDKLILNKTRKADTESYMIVAELDTTSWKLYFVDYMGRYVIDRKDIIGSDLATQDINMIKPLSREVDLLKTGYALFSVFEFTDTTNTNIINIDIVKFEGITNYTRSVILTQIQSTDFFVYYVNGDKKKVIVENDLVKNIVFLPLTLVPTIKSDYQFYRTIVEIYKKEIYKMFEQADSLFIRIQYDTLNKTYSYSVVSV